MKNIINDASVNEWFTQQMASLTPMKMLLALLMGFIVGLIIALVYRKAFRGVLFSPSFANTLIMLCMITTPVVMCIKSNIALSMGMVGALSIVRFRTAVKDPLDTAYMFWALTMGILLGAGGLVRAYSAAARLAVEAAGIVTYTRFDELTLVCSYGNYQRYLAELPRFGAKTDGTDFAAEVTLRFAVPADVTNALCRRVTEMSNGTELPQVTGKRFDRP